MFPKVKFIRRSTHFTTVQVKSVDILLRRDLRQDTQREVASVASQ